MDEAYEALAAKLARVEHLLSRNSGIPPVRRPWTTSPGKPAPRARSSRHGGAPKRKPGKQPGAPGFQDRFTIHGYLSTAAKHGHNVMTAMRQAITGDPWMPPHPVFQAWSTVSDIPARTRAGKNLTTRQQQRRPEKTWRRPTVQTHSPAVPFTRVRPRASRPGG
jgi:hypothetical protein